MSSVVSHVIFDLDGLLLDTEKIVTFVTKRLLERYGKTLEWSMESKLAGVPPLDSARLLIEFLDLPMTPEEYLDERAKFNLEEYFMEAELMPGATELIQHLHKVGIPMAIATSSLKRGYDLKVTKHQELFKLMSHVVCSDDSLVKKGKPAPDIYLAAAQRFTNPPSPSNVLVLEDAASGVEAAKTAGMLCVMVPDERLDPARTKLADKVIKSLDKLDLNEFGIPPITK